MYQWIFFLDSFVEAEIVSEEAKSNEFIPLVPRYFESPDSYNPYGEKFENLGKIEKRRLVVDVQEVRTQTELNSKATQLSWEISRLSEVRCEPDMESIRNLLERDFLSPTF